jgi:flagellar biosynthesis GTPase FlhF
MALRNRHYRKSPSTPEVQTAFFDRTPTSPAFFNPAHSIATSTIQRQEGSIAPPKPEEEQPVQKMTKEEEKPPVQKMTKEEEKPVQKMAKEEEKPVQKMAKEEEKPPVQKMAAPTEEKPKRSSGTIHPGTHEEAQEQTASLPDRLKMGIEALSGISMDDVKVHYNSLKPRQIGALAYTQGTDIYLAPGQEQHLSHEAWHVVQQKQGRVAPTRQAKGIEVNDDRGLEQEATAMGQKAASGQHSVT